MKIKSSRQVLTGRTNGRRLALPELLTELKISFQVLIVMGGRNGNGDLDSTETLDTDASSWITSEARMPRPMTGLRAANIDNRVLIFGNYMYFIHHRPDITET